MLPALMAAGLVPATIGAQTFRVVTTVLDGDPLSAADERSSFLPGDRLSINVLLDTRQTGLDADTIAAALRFPAGALRKLLRDADGPAGTGWPIVEGKPQLTGKAEMPKAIASLVGGSFFSVTSSADNPACPCPEDNGPGMEAVIHFLIVDMMRTKMLAPGLYHLFQTDWVVPDGCPNRTFDIEVTDGPANGLRGLGDPVRNLLIAGTSVIVLDLFHGLKAEGATVDVECQVVEEPTFLRGDPNGDGKADLSDAVNILEHLFLGGTVACKAAADANGSGGIDLSDPISLLEHLFQGGLKPPPPFPECGPVPASGLDCERGCPGS
jgi:hypothetical protein